MKKLETEVIVVAGGPAGLAAAVSAAEVNAEVILFEKSNTTGGAGNMGMGPLAVESKVQKNQLINITKQEAYDFFMEYTHYRVDGKLVKNYIDKSADTIDWLSEMGVEFLGSFRYFPGSKETWHIVKSPSGVPGPRAASTMFKVLTEKAQELGVDIHLETPVKKLIKEDGKVVGVIAEDTNGELIEARAKAVIVATGGFGDNPEMIKEYLGYEWGKDLFSFRVPGVTGDGMKMCWEVGAAKTEVNMEVIFQIPDNMNHFSLDAVMRQPNLFVNKFGQRFINEEVMENTTYGGNAIDQQPGKVAYAILDENIIKQYKKNGLDVISLVHGAFAINMFDNDWKNAMESGYQYAFEADTIEELAEKAVIDVDGLTKTLEEYNKFCEMKNDEEFNKKASYLKPIGKGKGKIMAVAFHVGAYGSLGGIKINENTEVLDEAGNVIQGLYAAGTDVCTIYGDSYCFYLPGNSMGFALNSGRIAGENAIDYIDALEEALEEA